jgi:hypothetical protein
MKASVASTKREGINAFWTGQFEQFVYAGESLGSACKT